jgi:hypothetical protein
VHTAVRKPVLAAAVALIFAGALSACFTGQRSSYAPDDTAGAADATGVTGPESTATAPSGATGPTAFASLFGAPARTPETATYSIRPTTGTGTVTAIVSREAGRTVVSVRNVQYRTSASGPTTCRLETNSCTKGFNAQPISDLNISAQFWGPGVRQELRSPTLAARIGPVTTHSATFAGQSSTCIDVPGPQVTEQYCALPTGMVAHKNTARVEITLVAYSATFDDSLWSSFPGS